MSQVIGFDIQDYYKRNSSTNGYLRLNYDLKAPILKRMRDHAHKLGMRFYVSDAHHKHLCDNTNCCGMSEAYNYNKGQFTEALLIAKEKGEVRWADIEPHVERFKQVDFKNAAGFSEADKRCMTTFRKCGTPRTAQSHRISISEGCLSRRVLTRTGMWCTFTTTSGQEYQSKKQ